MTVTLAEVTAAAELRRASLAAESAGYLVLSAADQVLSAPRRVALEAIGLRPDGRVILSGVEPCSEVEAERDLRGLLLSLLLAASSVTPALLRAARRATGAGLPALISEVEAALIPVNRAAAQRALARLSRETERALGQGLVVPAHAATSLAEAGFRSPVPPVAPAAPALSRPQAEPVSAEPEPEAVDVLIEPEPTCPPLVEVSPEPERTRPLLVGVPVESEPPRALLAQVPAEPEPTVVLARRAGSSEPPRDPAENETRPEPLSRRAGQRLQSLADPVPADPALESEPSLRTPPLGTLLALRGEPEASENEPAVSCEPEASENEPAVSFELEELEELTEPLELSALEAEADEASLELSALEIEPEEPSLELGEFDVALEPLAEAEAAFDDEAALALEPGPELDLELEPKAHAETAFYDLADESLEVEGPDAALYTEPTPAPPPPLRTLRREPLKSDVQDLLHGFQSLGGPSEPELRRELSKLAGLSPTPPPTAVRGR